MKRRRSLCCGRSSLKVELPFCGTKMRGSIFLFGIPRKLTVKVELRYSSGGSLCQAICSKLAGRLKLEGRLYPCPSACVLQEHC